MDLAKYKTAAALEAHISRAKPVMGCNPDGQVTHFQLIARVAESSTHFAEILKSLASRELLDVGLRNLDTEFKGLLSTRRRELIRECLEKRLTKYAQQLGIGI